MSSSHLCIFDDDQEDLKNPQISLPVKKTSFNRIRKLKLIENTKDTDLSPLNNKEFISKGTYYISNSNNNKENIEKNIEIIPINKSLKSIEFIEYEIHKNQNLTLKGKRIHFQLFQKDQFLYHTKMKPITNEGIIYMNEGSEMHFNSIHSAAILIGINLSSFSLREKDEYGDELMNLRFFNINNNTPRSLNLHFFKNNNLLPEKLFSKKPKFYSEAGEWVLNLSGRKSLKSIKNCVLLDSNNQEYIIITKKNKNILKIESLKEIDPKIIFTIGISSFLYPK